MGHREYWEGAQRILCGQKVRRAQSEDQRNAVGSIKTQLHFRVT